MNRLDVSKILFYVVSMTVIVGLSFACGLYSGRYQTSTFRAVWTLKNTIEESFGLVSKEATTLTKIHPEHFLQPARYDGAGVTVNDFSDGEKELIFLSGFFNESNELRLIRRDGLLLPDGLYVFLRSFQMPAT